MTNTEPSQTRPVHRALRKVRALLDECERALAGRRPLRPAAENLMRGARNLEVLGEMDDATRAAVADALKRAHVAMGYSAPADDPGEGKGAA